MKKLLIVMAGEPLTTYYHKKYSILRDQKNKVLVKCWNLLPIINKKINNKYFSKGKIKIYKNKNFLDIETIASLKKELNKLPKSFYFANNSPKLIKSLIIERLLYFKGGKKISLQLGGIPTVESSFLEKLRFRVSNFSLLSIIKILRAPSNFLANFIIKILWVNPILFFVPNRYWFEARAANVDISKIKKIHDYEYEVYKKFKNHTKKKNLIVFIDEMKESPFDHDLYWGYSKSLELNRDEYWQKIDKFLSLLQAKTGIDPVIAAAHRRRNGDFPIKRKFILNKTPNLIKD